MVRESSATRYAMCFYEARHSAESTVLTDYPDAAVDVWVNSGVVGKGQGKALLQVRVWSYVIDR